MPVLSVIPFIFLSALTLSLNQSIRYIPNTDSLEVPELNKGIPRAETLMFAEMVEGLVSNHIKVYFKVDVVSSDKYYYVVKSINGTNETINITKVYITCELSNILMH